MEQCILPYKALEVPLGLDDVSIDAADMLLATPDVPDEAGDVPEAGDISTSPDVSVEASDVATSTDLDQEFIVEQGPGRDGDDVSSNVRVDNREDYEVHLTSPQIIDEVCYLNIFLLILLSIFILSY